MKILFAAAEAAPFAMTGGLAEMTSSLAKALHQSGHDVRILLPFYRCVRRCQLPISAISEQRAPLADGGSQVGTLYQSTLGDIPVYFLEHAAYFDRSGLYGDAAGDYPDNARRFAFFCHGVLDLLPRIDFYPDIIHCHDWQTALIPYLLRQGLARGSYYKQTSSVFTIHNLAYQGLFPPESLADLGLDHTHFTMDRLEFYGKVSLLKGGIIGADMVTTVSQRYAAEILTRELGCGLEGVLRQRAGNVVGILNGIDPEEWNPAADRTLIQPYQASSLAGKSVAKAILQQCLGLTSSPATPLLGMVTRLVEQKGIELLLGALPWLLAQDVQMVILGTGDRHYVDLLRTVSREWRNRFALVTEFNPDLSHRIFAGSDLYLMPSHYEPCGIGQLIALRYGAVPVVRSTGGLADTVIDKIDSPSDYTGFVFNDFTVNALTEALSRALAEYAKRADWQRLVCRGMNVDFSWHRSAQHYVDIYRLAMKAKWSS